MLQPRIAAAGAEMEVALLQAVDSTGQRNTLIN
jgi:hypothetical protein